MKCLEPNPERLERRKFTPQDINLCDWNEVKKCFEELLSREINNSDDLEQYYCDVSDLNSALTEEFCRIQLAISVNTSDVEAQKRFAHFNETIMAQSAEISTELDSRFLDSPYLKDLDQEQYEQLIRLLKNSRDLFRKENIPLDLKNSHLAEKYNRISGGLSVEFLGKTRNLSEMAVYQKDTDRNIRQAAWEASMKCRLENQKELDALYDEMIDVRTRIAKNAGFENYRDYRHIALNRFDYSPEHCEKFHSIIENHVVKALKERRDKRREKLGLKTLKPWDLAVDVEGREALKPFTTQEELVAGCTNILDRIYPKLGDTLRLLKAYNNLDLMTRHNKAPVGFNMPLDETRASFIFMNATGHHSDVIVLLHESGHAVETRACINQEIFQYRHTPQEWGECASQSMELLGLEHLDVFYPDKATQIRCIQDKLESILVSFVYTARIDAFQQWIYTHPDHSQKERADKWVELAARFDIGGDYTGYESELRCSWQGIPHLFIVPFYYIEYGIAQMGALQVYKNAKTQGFDALENWLSTMKIGYSRSIPELYQKAGLSFEFWADQSEELIEFLVSEINRYETC